MIKKTLVAFGSLLVFAAGCGKKPAEGPGAKAPPPAAAASGAAPTAVAPAGVLSIGKFKFGSSLGADGSVGNETPTLAPGDTAYASFEIYNPLPGGKVRASFMHMPDKKAVAKEEVAVPADKPLVAVKTETRGWAPGEYLLDIALVSGETVAPLGTMSFTIAKAR